MRQTLFIRDDIILSLPDGPIGISFSGGADSTLLLYLALKQLRRYPIYLFTVSVSFREFNQHHITANVLNKVCSLTNNYNVFQHFTIGNNSSAIDAMFDQPNKFALNYNVITAILAGGNANPPDDVVKDTHFFTADNGRPPLDNGRNPNYVRSIKQSPILYSPFVNLNKQDILRIYKDNNILDDVLPLTQSCWTHPPCGDCWHCFEKNWGLKFDD